MTHDLTVISLWLLLALAMTLLIALVTCIEPGAYERYRHGLAYHRAGGRHARPRETTTLTAAEAAS